MCSVRTMITVTFCSRTYISHSPGTDCGQVLHQCLPGQKTKLLPSGMMQNVDNLIVFCAFTFTAQQKTTMPLRFISTPGQAGCVPSIHPSWPFKQKAYLEASSKLSTRVGTSSAGYRRGQISAAIIFSVPGKFKVYVQ